MKEGDKINYTITKKTARGRYTISAKEGVFVKSFEGGKSLVKAKNGRFIEVETVNIRPIKKQNALTEAILKAGDKYKNDL